MSLFQFYISTISTMHKWLRNANDVNFNSTLVRLARCFLFYYSCITAVFQFYISTISTDSRQSIEYSQPDFNSTLVRLALEPEEIERECNVISILH